MIKPSEFPGKLMEVVSNLPPGTVGSVGLLLDSLLKGKPEVAAQNARVVASALAIKAAARAPYRAKR
jgi:hypothetical protein